MANLIPTGTTQVQSADFAVAAATPVTLELFGQVYGDPFVDILYKNTDGTYTARGQLNQTRPQALLTAPGTYAVLRWACGNPIGVDNSL